MGKKNSVRTRDRSVIEEYRKCRNETRCILNVEKSLARLCVSVYSIEIATKIKEVRMVKTESRASNKTMNTVEIYDNRVQ